MLIVNTVTKKSKNYINWANNNGFSLKILGIRSESFSYIINNNLISLNSNFIHSLL